MLDALVITNTSPLLYLHQVGYLDILKQLYGAITVPPAVQEELEEGIRLGINAPDVASLDWVNILPVAAALPPSVAHLGPGESEVIALGLETANSLLILDDLLARRIAGSLSLKCTGTLGILVKSKQVGLIPSVSSVIATLRVQGMWLSDAVVEVMLKLSGEQLR